MKAAEYQAAFLFKGEIMAKSFLFDWGDTLMVDFPDEQGKMCEWNKVQAVDGAADTLAALSAQFPLYIATGAKESNADDIRKAFSRVDMDKWLCGYFSEDNVGVAKGSIEFYLTIATKLTVSPRDLVMVGDNYNKDILPALEAGLWAVWLAPAGTVSDGHPGLKVIHHLSELQNIDEWLLV